MKWPLIAAGLLVLCVGASLTYALRRLRYEELSHADYTKRLDALLPQEQKRRMA